MTAYELADYMDDNIDAYYASEQKHLDNAANMLRKQADRIAELEKDLHMIQRHYDQLNTQTKPLSEKELYEVFNKCYPNNGDGDVVTLVDFARAIEERHGIK